MGVNAGGRKAARILGAGTIAYSMAAIARPSIFARPCGLGEPGGSVSESSRRLITAIAVRDSVVSAAMVLGRGRTRQVACVTRALCDYGDAAVFGSRLTDPRARAKVVTVAAGWGTLCLLAGLAAGRH
ncbi:MAG: hypothetical protein ACT4PP_07770 [Sporichthyaceae bacterium]